MLNRLYISVVLAISLLGASGSQIILTNDDGWAVAQLRSEYNALKGVGHKVILSAPAVNKSGTGSSTATPTTLTAACQFDTCPKGSPAYGKDANDSNINYVNAYPVDAVKYAIRTLAPLEWGSVSPALVVSGTNIGNNLGSGITGSGTVGAACAAALEGIPAIAISGSSGSTVSYTTLTNTSASSTKTSVIYTALVLKLTKAMLAKSGDILPRGIALNVNFASTSSCSSASDYKFVLTRVSSSSSAVDVTTCGTNKLSSESSTVTKGCIATVSVIDASTKKDVSAATQGLVLERISSLLQCV